MAVVSSCREMYGLSSSNERNPYSYLPALNGGNYKETAGDITRRKAGTTSSHHGPYGFGYTRATMVHTDGCKSSDAGANPRKCIPQSGLESATRLHEVRNR